MWKIFSHARELLKTEPALFGFNSSNTNKKKKKKKNARQRRYWHIVGAVRGLHVLTGELHSLPLDVYSGTATGKQTSAPDMKTSQSGTTQFSSVLLDELVTETGVGSHNLNK
jgi:hypothetical protein